MNSMSRGHYDNCKKDCYDTCKKHYYDKDDDKKEEKFY